MARRVTTEDIVRINEVYYVCKNYSKTAEATGWSSSTIKKYVKPDYIPQNVEAAALNETEIIIPSIDETIKGLSSFERGLCVLTLDEMKELPNLWKEIMV